MTLAHIVLNSTVHLNSLLPKFAGLLLFFLLLSCFVSSLGTFTTNDESLGNSFTDTHS